MNPLAATVLLFLAPAPKTVDPSEAFFAASSPVPTFRIEMDKASEEQLRRDPRKYVHANVKVQDKTYQDVGLHLKGAAGSSRPYDDKPAMTLNADKYRDDQKIHGMDKFHLNNSVQDDFYLNEIITGEMFRRAGVPTARGTHAFVELNGRKVGLYVVKEGYDKTFLKHHFENNTGNLYDGGFLQDIDANLKLDSGKDCEWKDLKTLEVAARTRDHKKRIEALEKVLDVDKFIALWAVEVMCCDWDGYTRNRNNFRIYHDPKSGKFVFFAHGKDQMFQNLHDGLVTGWGGLIARKLWETEEGRKRYNAKLKEMLEKQFKLDDLNSQVDSYSKRLKDPLNAMQKGYGDQYLQNVREYKNRLKVRVEYLSKEIPKLKS